MAAIASLSDLVNRLTGGVNGTPENLWFFKVARQAGAAATAPIAGRMASLWTYDGSPGAGVAPTTVAVPTNATNGGLKQVDPGGGREKWLVSGWASGMVAGQLILYDRLLHIGGLDGTVTTPQTVGGTISRHTDGVGNFAFIEIYLIIGATSRTVTAQYDGVSGNNQNTPAVVIGNSGFREVSRAIMLPVAAGDTGVIGVDNVTLSATTGTAGNFGVTIGHPLMTFDIVAGGVSGGRTFAQGLPGIPKIDTDACLAFLWMPATTTAPEVTGGVGMVEA